ncbi:MAG: SRPBCC family protein [Thaumarchaeota archaeon]|nr:SRPBCC family protein [Nitrososphaerota archaeon]
MSSTRVMTFVRHTIEIAQPPSTLSKILLDGNRIKDWAPIVVDSSCPQEVLKEGATFSIKADLKPMGRPRFEFDNIVEKISDREIVWRQTKGSMKRLEWRFELDPAEKGTKLALTIDYQMPYSIIGKLLDKVKMHRVIDAACQVNLEGLKRKAESPLTPIQ